MAYVYDPSLSEEENARKQAEEQGRPQSGVLGEGGFTAGATPAGVKTGSGTYTNLQQYLEENKSQPGAMAGKIAESLRSEGESAKSALEGVASEARQKIEAGRIPQTGVIEEGATNPTGVVSDPEKLAAFRRERDAAYTGPSGLEDLGGFQSAQDKLKSLQERTGLIDTESGRIELLKSLSPEGSGIGSGKLALNQLLLGTDPNARETLATAVTPYSKLQDYLAGESTQAREAAKKAAEEAAATRGAVSSRFTGEGGVIPTFESDLTSRTEAMRQEAADRLAQQRSGIEMGFLTPDLFEGLGIGTPDDVRRALLYGNVLNDRYGAGFSPLDYFHETGSPEGSILPQNVATPEEYDTYLALAELMGISPSTLTPDTRSQAGTANLDLADLNMDVLRGVPGRLSQEDQAVMDLYGVTVEPDGRLSISNPELIAVSADPAATISKLQEIAARGVGNLPGGVDATPVSQFDDATRAAFERMLGGGMVQPGPNPGPEQPNGGAPQEFLVTPPPNGPNTPPTVPAPFPDLPDGSTFYGVMGDNSPLYVNQNGEIVDENGNVQQDTVDSLLRDPNDWRLYRPGNPYLPDYLQGTPEPPAPPPPHPQGFEYYGWMDDGTPVFLDAEGNPIYYDGTAVQAFGIERDPITGQITTVGGV